MAGACKASCLYIGGIQQDLSDTNLIGLPCQPQFVSSDTNIICMPKRRNGKSQQELFAMVHHRSLAVHTAQLVIAVLVMCRQCFVIAGAFTVLVSPNTTIILMPVHGKLEKSTGLTAIHHRSLLAVHTAQLVIVVLVMCSRQCLVLAGAVTAFVFVSSVVARAALGTLKILNILHDALLPGKLYEFVLPQNSCMLLHITFIPLRWRYLC